MTRNQIIEILKETDPDRIEAIRQQAHQMLVEHCGNGVYLRGLVEVSNICNSDCYYCGIRKSNPHLSRYTLEKKEILQAADACRQMGLASMVLQSGERNNEAFVSFIEDAVRSIKQRTKTDILPQGLGITLSVGEQTEETYKRFYNAGAHRYLLRIESSNSALFKEIHPSQQKIESRIRCLETLKRLGFQTGTGVMIGLPGQTVEDLADDILFFKEMDVDMIGMGPYLVHSQTPMNHTTMEKDKLFLLALKMNAATRMFLKNVNIASTTALETLMPDGRVQGLRYGANVIMPQFTPSAPRKIYMLYDNKPVLGDTSADSLDELNRRLKSEGREIGFDQWGDSRHFKSNRSKSPFNLSL